MYIKAASRGEKRCHFSNHEQTHHYKSVRRKLIKSDSQQLYSEDTNIYSCSNSTIDGRLAQHYPFIEMGPCQPTARARYNKTFIN